MVDLVPRLRVSRREINSAYEDAASSLPTKAVSCLPSPGMDLLLLGHSPIEAKHVTSLSVLHIQKKTTLSRLTNRNIMLLKSCVCWKI